jgi:putative tricarboxylic transport membrane protein
VLPTITELAANMKFILLGSVIGTVIGIIPGTGATVAVVLAYDWAKRISRHREEFGQGAIEGIMAPEAANNAVQGGALVPLLSLGVPGDSSAAILLGALIIQGYTPGPRFFAEAGKFAYAIFVVLLLANIAMILYQTVLIRLFVKVLEVPLYILSPSIIVLSLIGSYAIRNNLFDAWIALAFGVAGYYLTMYGYPIPPLVLGVILGPMAEAEFRRALALSGGDPTIFVSRPISLILLLVAAASLAGTVVAGRRRLRQEQAAARS